MKVAQKGHGQDTSERVGEPRWPEGAGVPGEAGLAGAAGRSEGAAERDGHKNG